MQYSFDGYGKNDLRASTVKVYHNTFCKEKFKKAIILGVIYTVFAKHCYL